MSNTVTVNKNVTNVVTVTAQGPQGIQGPSGSQGAGFNSSSYTTTSSFNTFTGSYQTDSSSFNTRIGSLTSATSSYVQNSQTGSFATTGSNTFKGTQTIHGNVFLSGSFPLVYNNNATNNMLFGLFDGSTIHGPYYQLFGNQYPNSAQRGGAEFVYDTRNGGDANFHISSYNGSTWTQKFRVDDNGAQITGSLNVSGSLNANAQIYEGSFLEQLSPAYPSGLSRIYIDQDLITNPNYTRVDYTITVHSPGSYRIYAQCNIEVASGLSSDAELLVLINNNPYKAYYIKNIKTAEMSTYNISCVANLNTGDTIEFAINSNTQPYNLYTFSKLSTSVVCSYMTIEKLN